MEWVKASKRLPELNKEISFRINERRYAGKMIEQGVFQHNGYACAYGVGSVEWLDESSSPVPGDVKVAAKIWSDEVLQWNIQDDDLRAAIMKEKYDSFLAGHAYKGQQGGIPLFIVEKLEKANPYNGCSTIADPRRIWNEYTSKLRSLLQSQPK